MGKRQEGLVSSQNQGAKTPLIFKERNDPRAILERSWWFTFVRHMSIARPDAQSDLRIKELARQAMVFQVLRDLQLDQRLQNRGNENSKTEEDVQELSPARRHSLLGPEQLLTNQHSHAPVFRKKP
jgi:hypothetical protein